MYSIQPATSAKITMQITVANQNDELDPVHLLGGRVGEPVDQDRDERHEHADEDADERDPDDRTPAHRWRAYTTWGNPWFPHDPSFCVPRGRTSRGLPAGKAGLRPPSLARRTLRGDQPYPADRLDR